MVHGDDYVVFLVFGKVEERVGGEGPLGVDADYSCVFDGGCDGIEFLLAQEAVFPGVGVEACDGYFRILDAELLSHFVGEDDLAEDAFRSESLGDLAYGKVVGDKDDFQFVRVEGHSCFRRMRFSFQEVRMARVPVSGHTDTLFVERGGD